MPHSSSALAVAEPDPPYPVSKKAQARAARRAERDQRGSGSAPPLVAKNPTQQTYIDILKAGGSVFAIGPAGTGKTYLPARIAAQRLVRGEIGKIVLARVTESDPRHKIGFRPGNTEAKMQEWVVPMIEAIRAEVSGATLDKWRQGGQFEVVPFETMRGRTFENAAVLLDEAQNATVEDLMLILTRPGEDTQMVVMGDTEQTDISRSGLPTVTDLSERFGIMPVIEFDETQVVRSALARAWVHAFRALKRGDLDSNVVNLDSLPAFVKNAAPVTKS